MTARAVDGRLETCEWKVDSSVIFVMIDMVDIKEEHFDALSTVYTKSLWLAVADCSLVNRFLVNRLFWNGSS